MIKNRTERLVIAGLFLALGIVVPQLFHIFPVANTGGVLLPMHIPVLLCGMLTGPLYGIAVGAMSPILSFLITGMPTAVRLPFMVCELMVYGLVAGLMYKAFFSTVREVRVYISLITAMICGRLAYLFAILGAISIFDVKNMSAAAVLDALILGIPGIVLQLVLVPGIVISIDRAAAGKGRKSLGQKHTFVCRSKSNVWTSEKNGIAPIMEILKERPEMLNGARVADRVIGKAAALLLIKGGISVLYTEIISVHALNVLKNNGNIQVVYDKKVPYIINRAGDGMCPMESATLRTDNPEEAYRVITEKLAEMTGAKEE